MGNGTSSESSLAAVGSIDITPDDSFGALPIAGHPGRRKPAQGVADALEANALVLRSGETDALFVSLDLLYVGDEIRSALCAEMADIIPPERIFTSASHTHFAPATDRGLPRLGLVSDAYVKFVIERTVRLARQLMQNRPNSVSARYALGRADHSVNRRRMTLVPRIGIPPWKHRAAMRPNFDGPRDETIRVLSFADQAGNLEAVCWSYACHPVCSPHFDLVSADFPGVVRDALRRRYGPIPVLYWQGFSGDVRPRAIKAAGELLKNWRQPRFGAFSQVQWKEWSQGLAECVLRAIEAPGRNISGNIGAARWAVPMDAFGPSAGNRMVTVHEIALGPNLVLFGVSAEPFCQYGEAVAQSRRAGGVIPIGCIDGVPGYLPTDAAVAEGGYEVEGFMPLFGVSGRFQPDVSRVFASRILSSR